MQIAASKHKKTLTLPNSRPSFRNYFLKTIKNVPFFTTSFAVRSVHSYFIPTNAFQKASLSNFSVQLRSSVYQFSLRRSLADAFQIESQNTQTKSSVFIPSFEEKLSVHSFSWNLPILPLHVALKSLRHCHFWKFWVLGTSDCYFSYTLGRLASIITFCKVAAIQFRKLF